MRSFSLEREQKVRLPDTAYWSTKKALAAYGLYAFFSLVLFALTAGGWNSFIIELLGLIPYVGLFIVLTIIVGMQHGKGRRWIGVNKTDFKVLGVVQLVMILINIGDCGDGPGQYFLIERIITAGDQCHSTGTMDWSFLFPVFFVVFGLYALLLTVLTIRAALNATADPTAATSLLHMKAT